jgi:hypothetical protein
VFTLQVTGQAGVPRSGVGAVALNITAKDATEGSFMVVWPSTDPRPATASLTVSPGKLTSRLLIVEVGTTGRVAFYNERGSVNVIVDVVGWFPPGQAYTPVDGARLLDTRPGHRTVDGVSAGGGPVGPARTINLRVAGRGSVPSSGVDAVVLSVTAVAPTANTYVTAWPMGRTRPKAANVNAKSGVSAGNLVVAQLGNGSVSLYNNAGSTNLVADVVGYFSSSAPFNSMNPVRLFDSRPGATTPDGQGLPSAPLGSTAVSIRAAGRAGIPSSGVGALLLNVTAIQPTTGSYLATWASGATKPGTASLNYSAGEVVGNLAIVKVGSNGSVAVANKVGLTHLTADVLGWFPTGSGFTPVGPLRLFDSRTSEPPPGPLPPLVAGQWQRVDPVPGQTDATIDGERNFGYQRIANSPAASNVLYLGTFLRGLWKSTDGGASWRKINTGTNGYKLDAGRLWAVAVDPTNANIVYTTPGYGSQEQGLYKSTDGGVNWTQMLPLSVAQATSPSIYSIAINPANPRHLLLGSHQPWGYPNSAGILESRDGGASWTVHRAISSWGWGHNVMFIDSTTWLLATQSDGFWRTTDSGRTWNRVSNELMMHGGGTLLRTPNGALYTGASRSMLRSTDNGATWRRVGPESSDGFYDIVSDGTYLYMQRSNTGLPVSPPSPYYISPISDGVNWSAQPGGQTFENGPFGMVYDSVNGVIVSSNWLGGLWRLKK